MFDHSFSFDCQDKVILVVEDDYDIGDIIENYLKREGMSVIRAMNGKQAIELHASQPIDLILLDIKLPELNGWEVLNKIRQKAQTPVIMLTALDQDIDKVMALRIGADDFVVKPFNPNEVIARVQAVLRRTQFANKATNKNKLYKNIEIDTDTHSVYIHSENKKILLNLTLTEYKIISFMIEQPHKVLKILLNLTLTEYKIISFMIEQPHKVFTRGELMNHCMNDSDALERTVDSHVSKLRKKLEEQGIFQMLINVRGVGYRLDNPLAVKDDA
ncbi:efflux system response regulator transcription factor AdeR [Acinetobacter baumannii]|nr:efflux system response regulator transcription factor AdeR [Acinetobacter baumannii]